MTKRKQNIVWAEMARRKKQFHNDKNWQDIKLWGLFSWGEVSPLLKTGELITDMSKENRTIWVRPSAEAYKKHIEPLLDHKLSRLEVMAGWH